MGNTTMYHHWYCTILEVSHGAKSVPGNPTGKVNQSSKLPAVQVAAILKEASKSGLGSQDWDARAAQEVAAARARGAQLPALVDRKQHRADFLRMKTERAEAAASSKPHDSGLAEAAAKAKAEVPAQHLLHSRV